MIELLVVIAVIAILVALLLPAVQQAREAARRSQCQGHLKQLALALHNYHDVFSIFPRGNFEKAGTQNGLGNRSWAGFSAHAQILPYLEQGAVYDRLDFSRHVIEAPNANEKQAVIDTFLCPSDLRRIPNGSGFAEGPGNNYAFSAGPSLFWFPPGVNGLPYPPTGLPNWNDQVGMFNYRRNVRLRDLTDGTSYVVMVAEQIQGDGNSTGYNSGDLQRGVEKPASAGASFLTVAEINAWGAVAKAAVGGAITERGDSGSNWIRGEMGQTLCNTLAGPNFQYPNVIACSGCNANDAEGLFPPRSRHPGGVQIALADGSVRFIADAIDNLTWQRLGAIQDGHPLGDF